MSGLRRVAEDPTLRVDGRLIRTWAEHAGVCVRPLLRQVTDVETGDTTRVAIPCKSTREQVCPPCATRARTLRQQQCREGWHLDDEPDQVDPEQDPVDDTPDTDDERADQDDDGTGDRRVRSTRRRDDAAALPRVPQEARTVGRTFTGRAGQVYRPSMFVTLTLPSYGRITPGTGTPVDPGSYDYRRAALDAIHLPRLLARWVQNLRRCAGYQVQYFAAVEPQKRLAPHVHLAIRGAIPRQVLRDVTRATYVQIWWPPSDDVDYDEATTRLPTWEAGAYRDPITGAPLPTWEEALDDRLHDARHSAATVLLLLGVPDRAVMGIMGWSKADMMLRYQHLTGTIRGDIAERVGALLWASDAPVVNGSRRSSDHRAGPRMRPEVRPPGSSPAPASGPAAG